MNIPDNIRNAISQGINCPICNKGCLAIFKEVVGIVSLPKIKCLNCHKDLQITYKENPFEILGVREYKE